MESYLCSYCISAKCRWHGKRWEEGEMVIGCLVATGFRPFSGRAGRAARDRECASGCTPAASLRRTWKRPLCQKSSDPPSSQPSCTSNSLPLNVDVLEFDFLDPPKVSKQQPSFELQHDQQKSTVYAPHSLCTKVWLNAKVSRTPFG